MNDDLIMSNTPDTDYSQALAEGWLPIRELSPDSNKVRQPRALHAASRAGASLRKRSSRTNQARAPWVSPSSSHCPASSGEAGIGQPLRAQTKPGWPMRNWRAPTRPSRPRPGELSTSSAASGARPKAQGNLVVGGFDAEGRDGSKITVNVPSAGRIPGGASVERAVPSGFNQGNSLTLNLNRSDFTTAKRIVDKINDLLGPGVAQAIDGGSVRVTAPLDPSQRVDYLSILENLEVDPGQAVAKVIINSRTGTIVIGQNVKVSPAGGSMYGWVFNFAIPHLDQLVIKTAPIVNAPTAIAAVFKLDPISATGTAIFFSALISMLILKIDIKTGLTTLKETLYELRWPILSIGMVLAFAFVTNYSGMSSTMALVLAGTGAAFPFFSPFLGWLGVFLTGSDTSSNALFSSLQATTAHQIGVSDTLMVAANTSGGVTGKMISPQSIAVACAATGLVGKESDLFRFTLKHSLFFATIVGLITLAQAYWLTGMLVH